MRKQRLAEEKLHISYVSLDEAIAELTAARERLGNDVTFNLDAYEDYGGPSVSCYLSYKRYETDEEMNERIADEQRRLAYERQQYERLAAKFGNKPGNG